MLFLNTEEAHTFGKKASRDDVKKLQESKKYFLEKFNETAETKPKTTEVWNQQMIWATRAQFCREALEAYERRS